MQRSKLGSVALSCVLLATTSAQAQVCNFSNTGINFGSLDLNNINQSTATGTITANCTGTRNRTITICPNIGGGSAGNGPNGDPRYMTLGTTQVGYNLYHNNGVGQIWGSYVWPFSPRPPAMSVTLSGAGNGTTQRTLFGRINGSNAPAGIYTSSFAGGHTLFDYGYAPYTCGPSPSARALRIPFSVQVTNINQCIISTSAMDFGTPSNLNTSIDATNAISIRCNTGVRYTVGLSNGTSGASSPVARQMTTATSTDRITYGIYTNVGRTTPWGTANNTTVSGTGTGQTQNITGYGRIPAQASPTPAEYSDTVVVTVTY